ncbi:MAG: hypothetical protein HKO72_05405 [Flavobacteriaceae bacterium]|nr:hypothetical protein [Flavobacteriaceae bacterium]NNM09214.1 hypothetical protein [Flavobacteriaceae bacterium]
MNSLNNKISFLIILLLSSIPSLIGPIANIGQWGGPNSPYLSQILTGIPTMIVGTWTGYKFIFLKGTNKRVESYNSAISKSLIIFLFTLLACLVSWSVCQEILLVLQKAFGMAEARGHGWFDGLIGLPIILIFSFIPCLIAAIVNGLVSLLIFKMKKTSYNNM